MLSGLPVPIRGIRDHVRNSVLVLLACLVLMAQDAAEKIGALEEQVQKHLQEQKPQLAIPVLREIVSLSIVVLAKFRSD